jgi:hypothetical protein
MTNNKQDKGEAITLKKLKPQIVPVVELKCQPEGEPLHTFNTQKVYLIQDLDGKEPETGFAICPKHNLEVSIIPMRTPKTTKL